jgi:signal transduction histidine kinase
MKGIRFIYDFNDPRIEYECIGELLSRALDNLISNAIRYAASEIILSCRKNQHEIIISVTDDGIGILPENIPFVFERFFKGENGNHGIGLSIVKSIVEQHGGSVRVRNIENGGASFIITLPIKRRR